MTSHVKPKSAVTGSNLSGKRLSRHRAELFDRFSRPFERLAREHRRSVRRLFSRAELRAVADISKRVRQRFHAANVKAGAAGRKWSANQPAFTSQLRRELMRALPNYRAWEALAKSYRRDYKGLERLHLAASVDPRVHVDFGDVLPPDTGETYEFTPPYQLHDTDIVSDDEADVDDLSLTVPDMGYLVNRIHYAQEDEPIIWTDIYGINWPARHASTTTCGINFTMPARGRLRVRATLQNFYSHIVLALRNRFGLSEGYLWVDVRLVIAISRPSQAIEFSTTLVHDGYESPGGAEATYQLPPLDNTMPHVFEATTDEVFPVSAGVQILAGTQIFIYSEIDDMAAYVDARLGWQLQELAVNIV